MHIQSFMVSSLKLWHGHAWSQNAEYHYYQVQVLQEFNVLDERFKTRRDHYQQNIDTLSALIWAALMWAVNIMGGPIDSDKVAVDGR